MLLCQIIKCFFTMPHPISERREMLTQSLPAASLMTGNRLPATRVLPMVSNYLIYMILSLIGPASSDLESSFLPALREAPGGVRRATRHGCGHLMVRLDATAISVASLPGAPTIDRPTGNPSTVAPGMLTCGTPVNPP